MAMDDLPLAVLAAIDMCNPKDVRLWRSAIDGDSLAFVADCICEVTADPGGNELKLILAAVGESRRDPAEGTAYVLPSAFARIPTSEQRHRIACRPHLHARRYIPLCNASSASIWRGIVVARKSSSSLAVSPLPLVNSVESIAVSTTTPSYILGLHPIR
jgi:hypothetical protein